MLGLVLPDITNPFFAEYERALEVAAAAHGYVLVVANSDANEAYESRIVSDLSNRHVDGLIMRTVLPPSGFRAMTLPGTPNCPYRLPHAFPGLCRRGRRRPRRCPGSGRPSHHRSWPPINSVDHRRRVERGASRAGVERRFSSSRSAAWPHRSDHLQPPRGLRSSTPALELAHSTKRDFRGFRSAVHWHAQGNPRSWFALPRGYCGCRVRRHDGIRVLLATPHSLPAANSGDGRSSGLGRPQHRFNCGLPTLP
jgi:Periplasmic binding proteins and sugar binding domain of LacI family